MAEPSLMIVIGDVLHEPWYSISINGQIPTWLADAERPGVVVRHSHGNKLGALGMRLDRWHEAARWSTHGRARIPAIDNFLGKPFRTKTPRVRVHTWGQTDQVAWHQNLPDMYAVQRWKVLGSLTQALEEPFDYVYFTTASSYVRVAKLQSLVDSMPSSGVYAGTPMVDWPSGDLFASGANRLFSRDVVELIVQRKADYANDVMEDAGIGRLLGSAGVTVRSLPSINIDSLEVLADLSAPDLITHHHFRVKSGAGLDRQDVELMHELHRRIEAAEKEETTP